MTYDRWKLRSDLDYEPCTEMARAAGCSCGMSRVWPTDIDPPEPVVDEDCPLHGRDPDREYEQRRDEGDLEPDCADDYRDDIGDGDVGSAGR